MVNIGNNTFCLDLRDSRETDRPRGRSCVAEKDIIARVQKWKSENKYIVSYCETSALTMEGLAKCFTTGVSILYFYKICDMGCTMASGF